jgi:hypothetical protein
MQPAQLLSRAGFSENNGVKTIVIIIIIIIIIIISGVYW